MKRKVISVTIDGPADEEVNLLAEFIGEKLTLSIGGNAMVSVNGEAVTEERIKNRSTERYMPEFMEDRPIEIVVMAAPKVVTYEWYAKGNTFVALILFSAIGHGSLGKRLKEITSVLLGLKADTYKVYAIGADADTNAVQVAIHTDGKLEIDVILGELVALVERFDFPAGR